MLQKRFNSCLSGAALVVSILVMTTVDADAYIDPGSSSYFFQLLIAGLTAVVYFFGSIKRWVLGLFKKGGAEPTAEENKLSKGSDTPDDSQVSR
jgi:hypothetical protein